MKLTKETDPMGQALHDYIKYGQADKLRVCSSLFEEDEIPVKYFFRTETDMPPLELKALELCKGRVLDVGAGSGCHSLALQKRGMDVTAIDISSLSVEVMSRRGVHQVQTADFMKDTLDTPYDTILLLMNGLGIAGTADKLPVLLKRSASLLRSGGYILADSTDLRYIFEEENGNFDTSSFDHYYGEVDYFMKYKSCCGPRFKWLYADFGLLQKTAANCNLQAELIGKGTHYDYLARISRQ